MISAAALAATWDEALVERVARLSEPPSSPDPLLSKRLGTAYERGLRAEPRAGLREAAVAGFVLARNHGSLLPLSGGSLRRVAVLGSGAGAALEGLRAALPGAELLHGGDPPALARAADVAVVVAGEDDLLRGVAIANPRTIAVVPASEPVSLPWLDQVPAVLLTWALDPSSGGALANVLLGAAEPGGRLPAAWPELPFGHGLGYSSWQYLAQDGPRVRLANTGTRRGREVVQLYADGRLAGFTVVEAGPGEEVVAEVELAPWALDADLRPWS
jgi:hypothetical protein